MQLPDVPARQRPMLRFLVVLTVASMAGLQGWQTLFNNFAVEVARLEGSQVGVIQSVREIPGFLALLAVWVMLVVPEHRLSALSIVVLGVGTGLTGFFPSYLGLAATTLAMSFGFHYYETTNQSLTLQYFDKGTSPLVFGVLRSLSAATSIGVGVLIYLFSGALDYRALFLALGVAITALGLWGLVQNPVDRDLVPQRRHMVLRWRYRLFYFLTFMAGARRQIFIAFSAFLLVKIFNYSVREITVLFVVNNVLGYLAGPAVGRAVVRFGERRVLTVEYAGLVAIFLAYALTDSKALVAFLYLLDHLLFHFSIAIRTYFQKIADPADIAPSMAVGFTINHIAAVVLPAVGGALWMIDYRIPFVAGSVLALVSLVASQWVPDDRAPAAGEAGPAAP